ncbi:MAG: hypothetical protein ACI4RP_01280, partial [Acutalibacteraceae bacterium]
TIISSGITDGKIICTYFGQDKAEYYDVKNNSWHQICAYTNGVRLGSSTLYDSSTVYFENGNVFMTFVGADDKLYFAVYNENGEKAFEPIATKKFVGVSCGMIVTNDDNFCIYDYSGEKRFEFDAYKVEGYSDDVAMVYDNNGRYYIDKDGKKLFEKIKYNGEIYKIEKD